jgi:uncharacterized phage infection (PIP) family protein YhgE
MPILLIVGLAVALPAIYLSATSDPQAHLAGLPVGLVIEDQIAGAGPRVAGDVGDAIQATAGDTLAVTRMTHGELDEAMAQDRLAGAVVIPANFDTSIASLLPGAPRTIVPTISIVTNAGDGGLSAGLLIGNLTPLLEGVGEGLGSQLIAAAGAATLPSAHAALLSAPFDIVSMAYEPLPDHSGMGTSAFYYALVLVLLSFIGASLVGPLVDSALGFSPSELGPLVARARYTAVSRRRTFVTKAAILVAAAPLAALTLQLVAWAIGITAPDPVVLWLFATAVIAAVGTSILAVFAIFGPGIGSLVNTLLFVALAMVSSGGIVPIEATPPFFRWVSEFAPFRHVIDGTRALFYFDGNADAGLGAAWIAVLVGGAIGILAGLIVTTLYGRVRAFSRHPRPEFAAVDRAPEPRPDGGSPVSAPIPALAGAVRTTGR